MGKTTVTRRAFAQLAAATGAIAAMGVGTRPAVALTDGNSGTAGERGIKKIRSCCRGCGKVECGVWVYIQDGKVVRTEGDETCFNTMGNHCSKGQASIQAAYHPDGRVPNRGVSGPSPENRRHPCEVNLSLRPPSGQWRSL